MIKLQSVTFISIIRMPRAWLVSHHVNLKVPNIFLLIAERWLNSLHKPSTSVSSSKSWCVWHMATAFRLCWLIVERSHVFRRLRQLKLLSAVTLEAGDTSNNISNCLTCGYSPWTSHGRACIRLTASVVVVKDTWCRNIVSSICSPALSNSAWVCFNYFRNYSRAVANAGIGLGGAQSTKIQQN